MIISAPEDFNVADLFIDVSDADHRLFLKYEGMNFAGSIKLKTASSLVSALEQARVLHPGMTLVESTSGSLGIALAQIGVTRGYRVHCIIDSCCSERSEHLMRALGATLERVTEPHPDRGLLGARLDRVQEILDAHPDHVWVDQYHRDANWQAHYASTGREILHAFPEGLGVLFVGIGTSGTGTGVARYLREHSPSTYLVAIDVEGSVTFGGAPSSRHFSGLGAGVPPPFFDPTLFDELLLIGEADTIVESWGLARRGFVLGASTGTVVSGARRWLAGSSTRQELPCVAIAPDGGDPYLATLYNSDWVSAVFGAETLARALAAAQR